MKYLTEEEIKIQGAELMTIVDDDDGWDEVKFSKDAICNIDIIMRKLSAAVEPIAKMYSEVFRPDEDADCYERFVGLENGDVIVQFSYRGCGRGCCPGYDSDVSFPMSYLWDPEPLQTMHEDFKKAKALKAEKERLAREARLERDKAEREKRDLEEFKRLQKKFVSKTGGEK